MIANCRQAVVLGLVLFAIGCGRQLKVQGKVTLDGTPVESGSISFEPADGSGSEFGTIIADGNYFGEGPATANAGPKIVRIRASRKTGKKIPAGPTFPPDAMTEEVIPLPRAYSDTSKLTADLK